MNAATSVKSAAANKSEGIILTTLLALPNFVGSALLLKLFDCRIIEGPVRVCESRDWKRTVLAKIASLIMTGLELITLGRIVNYERNASHKKDNGLGVGRFWGCAAT